MDYVKWKDLRKALKTKRNRDLFGEFFGIQTCLLSGPYAHDVEAVLERMASGKRTGSQLFWD